MRPIEVDGRKTVSYNRSPEKTHARERTRSNVLAYVAIVLALAVGALSMYVFVQNASVYSSGLTVIEKVEPARTKESSSSVFEDAEPQRVGTSSSLVPDSSSASPPVVVVVNGQDASDAQTGGTTSAQTIAQTSIRGEEWLESTSVFWGIWTLASKEYDECASYVSEVRAQGYDAYMTNTSMWSNLNSESWYVVTIGVYASESDANAALPGIRDALDHEAYVKFSGAYAG